MLDKWINVMSKNVAYVVVMIIAAVFFIYFSDGLIEGLIAAVAAMIAYTCGATLYKEYKKAPAPKAKPAKKAAAKKKK